MNIEEKYKLAVEEHRAGRSGRAIELYGQVLAENPAHHQSMHFLGMAYCQTKDYAQALSLIQQAILICPNAAEYYLSLGVTLDCLGRPLEAMTAFGRALHLRPDYPQAHNNLGNVHAARGEWKQALAYFEIAISRNPEYVEGHYNKANAMGKLGRYDEAIVEFNRTLQLQTNFTRAWEGLGNALHMSGRAPDAVAAFQKAIELNPNNAQTHYLLGISLHQLDRFDEAIAQYQAAVALNPEHSQAHANMGVALKMIGKVDLAVAAYESALKADPANLMAHDALLYLIHFKPDYGPDAIFQRHKQFEEQYGKPLAAEPKAHPNDRSPDRRLKVAYISPDFREHVVGWNMLPLLGAHDHERYEIYCYAHVPNPDQMTRRLRDKADIWRDIRAAGDKEVVQMMRSDKIDILVDLAVHMHGTRLMVLAHRPAPVQATYLGYCSTTGLEAVQYRLSDAHFDPPDSELGCYVENTIRLPRTYWCFHPAGPTPDVTAAPAIGNGYFTFGCLNNAAKVSPAAMDLWAQILVRTPKSRLLLHSWPGAHREDILHKFNSQGVEKNRIEFIPFQQWPQYIATFGRMDVALDPFPYSGGVSTFDALWMGVPVVTLSGHTAVGRGGRSILTNVGLPELIAYSPEDYVRIATEAQKWIELRPGMRQRVKESPLMDAKAFARDVESAYRQMWTQWITQP